MGGKTRCGITPPPGHFRCPPRTHTTWARDVSYRSEECYAPFFGRRSVRSGFADAKSDGPWVESSSAGRVFQEVFEEEVDSLIGLGRLRVGGAIVHADAVLEVEELIDG